MFTYHTPRRSSFVVCNDIFIDEELPQKVYAHGKNIPDSDTLSNVMIFAGNTSLKRQSYKQKEKNINKSNKNGTIKTVNVY